MCPRGLWTAGAVLLLGFCAGWLPAAGPASQATSTTVAPPEDGKLRIIAFGAHPDDCELKAGGTAAKWAAQGHHVKFVSVTNGDIGHWQHGRRPAGPAPPGRGRASRQDPGHPHAGPRHPRRRAGADAGEPPHHHPPDPRRGRPTSSWPIAPTTTTPTTATPASSSRTPPSWSRCRSSAPTRRT